MMPQNILDVETAVSHDQQLTPPPIHSAHSDRPPLYIRLQFVQRIQIMESYLLLNPGVCLRYPKLTEQLRSLPDFPLLKRAYPVESPDAVTNALYYDQLVRNCYRFFKEDLVAVGEQIKQWVSMYGRLAEIPIIDSFQVNARGWVECCVIKGLRWELPANPEQASQWGKYLDLHELFSIDRTKQIHVEDAIPGSPLIALYIRDTSHPDGHKGQLFWYNLDTRRPGAITDAVRYR